VVTGPQDAEASRYFEPLGKRAIVDDGGWRVTGHVGTTVRRCRDRYEEEGFEGLRDRRLGKPSPKRVPSADAQLMLKHFHEHLVRDHGFRWATPG
jgi:hypothetical protein